MEKKIFKNFYFRPIYPLSYNLIMVSKLECEDKNLTFSETNLMIEAAS